MAGPGGCLSIRDRQQEARVVLVGSHYIPDHHRPLSSNTCIIYHFLPYFLAFIIIDIKLAKITGSENERA